MLHLREIEQAIAVRSATRRSNGSCASRNACSARLRAALAVCCQEFPDSAVFPDSGFTDIPDTTGAFSPQTTPHHSAILREATRADQTPAHTPPLSKGRQPRRPVQSAPPKNRSSSLSWPSCLRKYPEAHP